MSDCTIIQGLEASELADNSSVVNADLEIEREFSTLHDFRQGSDTLAADVTAETIIADLQYDGIVKEIEVKTDGPVAASGVDFGTYTFRAYDAAGVLIGAAPIGALTSVLGFTKWIRRTLSGAALNSPSVLVVAGGTITMQVTKAGAGKILPVAMVRVRIRRQ